MAYICRAMEEDNNEDNFLNEDPVPYQRNPPLSKLFPGLVISSLKEQEDATRQYSAALSPVERMVYLHQLILIAYAEELKKPIDELWNKRIVIDKITW